MMKYEWPEVNHIWQHIRQNRKAITDGGCQIMLIGSPRSSYKSIFFYQKLPICGMELRMFGSFLLWPGFIPDSQSWAIELWAINREKLKSQIIFFSSLPSASTLSWLVSPGLLLLNTSGAVVLRQEVCELLQLCWFRHIDFF